MARMVAGPDRDHRLHVCCAAGFDQRLMMSAATCEAGASAELRPYVLARQGRNSVRRPSLQHPEN